MCPGVTRPNIQKIRKTNRVSHAIGLKIGPHYINNNGNMSFHPWSGHTVIYDGDCHVCHLYKDYCGGTSSNSEVRSTHNDMNNTNQNDQHGRNTQGTNFAAIVRCPIQNSKSTSLVGAPTGRRLPAPSCEARRCGYNGTTMLHRQLDNDNHMMSP